MPPLPRAPPPRAAAAVRYQRVHPTSPTDSPLTALRRQKLPRPRLPAVVTATTAPPAAAPRRRRRRGPAGVASSPAPSAAAGSVGEPPAAAALYLRRPCRALAAAAPARTDTRQNRHRQRVPFLPPHRLGAGRPPSPAAAAAAGARHHRCDGGISRCGGSLPRQASTHPSTPTLKPTPPSSSPPPPPRPLLAHRRGGSHHHRCGQPHPPGGFCGATGASVWLRGLGAHCYLMS